MRTYRLRLSGERFQAEGARDLFRQMHQGSRWNRDRTLDEYIVDLSARSGYILGQALEEWRTEEELLDRMIRAGLVDEEA